MLQYNIWNCQNKMPKIFCSKIMFTFTICLDKREKNVNVLVTSRYFFLAKNTRGENISDQPKGIFKTIFSLGSKPKLSARPLLRKELKFCMQKPWLYTALSFVHEKNSVYMKPLSSISQANKILCKFILLFLSTSDCW